MAYTIISQNNSTTTLSDGVNTITVPSRVNLTSGNFTIVEVNNNMATLEDGDGNVYRDIPCVATLAGEGGGGGSGLPDQTGHSGEFLTTDGSSASWSDKPLVNTSTAASSIAIGGVSVTSADSIAIGTAGSVAGIHSVCVSGAITSSGSLGVAIGQASYVSATSGTALGQNARVTGKSGISIGSGTASAERAYQIGYGTNSTAHSLSVGTYHNNTGKNYQLLDLTDGTIPTARLTKVNSTITLTAAGWSSNTQTVTVSGVTSTSVVLVAPDPSDTADYVAAGILCTSQTTDSLTFTATTTPTNDIDVNIVCL